MTDVPESRPGDADELDIEAPEADVYAQRQPVLDEDQEDVDGLSDEFDKANEADVVDQRTSVPGVDDDYVS